MSYKHKSGYLSDGVVLGKNRRGRVNYPAMVLFYSLLKSIVNTVATGDKFCGNHW